MIKVIGVRFRQAGKIYYFDPLDFDIEVGQHVIVETARGIEYGLVLTGPRNVEADKVIQPLKPVIRVATPDDDEVERKNKEKEKTAYHYVSEYLKKQDRKQKVFIVHRLDRETSGVLMFCKNEKIRDLLQKDWNKIVYLRGYMALVEGKGLKNGTLKNYLAESKSQQVYVTSKEKGKLAITHYKAIKEMKNQTLLEIQLDTGRKNQIRVQLSNIHHPIVGDKKYGATTNPLKRLGLHAHAFGFIHPVTKKKYEFKVDCPKEFYGKK